MLQMVVEHQDQDFDTNMNEVRSKGAKIASVIRMQRMIPPPTAALFASSLRQASAHKLLWLFTIHSEPLDSS